MKAVTRLLAMASMMNASMEQQQRIILRGYSSPIYIPTKSQKIKSKILLKLNKNR